MATAARLLRQARRASAASQRALAAVTPEYQSSIADFERGKHDPGVDRLERLLSRLGYSLVVLPTRRSTASDAADAIYSALQGGDERRAYRELIQLNDDLSSEHGPIRVALTVAPPAPVGDPRYDAFIAALVEHHLVAEHLPVPKWTSEPGRTLREPWIVDEASARDVAIVAPEEFRNHNVLIDPAELASV